MNLKKLLWHCIGKLFYKSSDCEGTAFYKQGIVCIAVNFSILILLLIICNVCFLNFHMGILLRIIANLVLLIPVGFAEEKCISGIVNTIVARIFK